MTFHHGFGNAHRIDGVNHIVDCSTYAAFTSWAMAARIRVFSHGSADGLHRINSIETEPASAAA
jgi:hypothetical protein